MIGLPPYAMPSPESRLTKACWKGVRCDSTGMIVSRSACANRFGIAIARVIRSVISMTSLITGRRSAV